MNVNTTLIALLAAMAMSACGRDQDHERHSTPAAAEPASDSRSASNETQAFYGDEAPVTIEAVPEDHHGHSHDHSHDDHDHEDSSEPHEH